MIKSITLKAQKKVFTTKLYKHSSKDVVFEFNPDVNIITGRNGSGKSVLLKILALNVGIVNKSIHAEYVEPLHLSKGFFETGFYTMPEYIEKIRKNREYPIADIDWDGQITNFLTPETINPKDMFADLMSPYAEVKAKQFLSGMELIDKMTSKNSSGEAVCRLLYEILNLPKTYPKYTIQANDRWEQAKEVFDNWIKSFKRKLKPTLLIDEIDSHLDIDNQSYFWEYIYKLSTYFQIIIVSHSIFAFKENRPNVKHIPLNKNYWKTIRNLKFN